MQFVSQHVQRDLVFPPYVSVTSSAAISVARSVSVVSSGATTDHPFPCSREAFLPSNIPRGLSTKFTVTLLRSSNRTTSDVTSPVRDKHGGLVVDFHVESPVLKGGTSVAVPPLYDRYLAAACSPSSDVTHTNDKIPETWPLPTTTSLTTAGGGNAVREVKRESRSWWWPSGAINGGEKRASADRVITPAIIKRRNAFCFNIESNLDRRPSSRRRLIAPITRPRFAMPSARETTRAVVTLTHWRPRALYTSHVTFPVVHTCARARARKKETKDRSIWTSILTRESKDKHCFKRNNKHSRF